MLALVDRCRLSWARMHLEPLTTLNWAWQLHYYLCFRTRSRRQLFNAHEETLLTMHAVASDFRAMGDFRAACEMNKIAYESACDRFGQGAELFALGAPGDRRRLDGRHRRLPGA